VKPIAVRVIVPPNQIIKARATIESNNFVDLELSFIFNIIKGKIK